MHKGWYCIDVFDLSENVEPGDEINMSSVRCATMKNQNKCEVALRNKAVRRCDFNQAEFQL